jgi:hypothetical protein
MRLNPIVKNSVMMWTLKNSIVSDSQKGLDVQFFDVKTQFETVITPAPEDSLQEMSPDLIRKDAI